MTSVTSLEAARELLLRTEAKTSIRKYMEYMARTNLPAFQHAPTALHHQLIIDELERLVGIEGIIDPEDIEDRLAISLPPGSAKSMYASIIFPTFLMARDPKNLILCISNSATIAEGFSRQRRAIMLSPEWCELAESALSPDGQSLAVQTTVDAGAVMTVGIEGTVTGLRANYLLIDDPISGFSQAASKAQLEKQWNYYISEARSRLKPNGVTCLIMTRWSSLDLIGRVQELHEQGLEKWRFVNVPMECIDGDTDIERRLKRKTGDRLWPEYFSQKMVDENKRSPNIWITLFQQRPLQSTNDWLPLESIRIVQKIPSHCTFTIGIDIALTNSTKSDYTVFSLCAICPRGSLTICEIYRAQVTADISSSVIIDWVAKNKDVVMVLIDDDNASKVWQKLVMLKARDRGIPIPLRMISVSRRNKEVRATPLQSLFLEGRVNILQGPMNTDLIYELSNFLGSAKNDDQVDAIGLCASELYKTNKKKEPVPIDHPIETQLGVVGGKIVLRETLNDLYKVNEDRKHSNRFNKRRI